MVEQRGSLPLWMAGFLVFGMACQESALVRVNGEVVSTATHTRRVKTVLMGEPGVDEAAIGGQPEQGPSPL